MMHKYPLIIINFFAILEWIHKYQEAEINTIIYFFKYGYYFCYFSGFVIL